MYRPRACSHIEVLNKLNLGHLIRRGLKLENSSPIEAKDGEPPVLVQPLEAYAGMARDLWLWSDGTLRAAPECVVPSSSMDRDWVV